MTSLIKQFEGIYEPNSPEIKLLSQIDPENLPRHMAVIMDGNGRWAEQRQLRRVEGHRAGIDAVRDVVETASRLSIPVLTLYAFSAENWKRPREEVATLMSLLKFYIRKELPILMRNSIQFQAIGRVEELPASVQRELQYATEQTQNNQGTRMVVALNYSGRLEIVDAFNSLLAKGPLSPVGEEEIQDSLYTAGLPEPDLMIRTSGEMRISNFLLWQMAYAEIYVTDVLWPDFRGLDLLKAVLEFQNRERRYGGIRYAPLQSAR